MRQAQGQEQMCIPFMYLSEQRSIVDGLSVKNEEEHLTPGFVHYDL